jgi:hypothetical protein
MDDRMRGVRTLAATLVVVLVSLAVAACGSSSNNSGQASSLLKDTFSGSHPVNSGNLSFSLTLTPSGSTTLTSPISLSFGGPFQSLGSGKLPKSDFDVSLSAQGKTDTLGLISTGTAGYVTLQGVSYQLPATTFQKLESSFAGVASSPAGGSGTGALGKLGIHPLDWLSGPSVVGQESVDGTDTTHIRATINVSQLLGDLDTFLQKASAVGVSGASKIPTSISPSTRSRIASEVQNPTFDVWTGNGDKTVRKLVIGLTLPVTGQVSTLLGGLHSAGIALTMRYADLNQPQTINAPTTVRPFSEFESKLKTFVAAIEGSVSGAAGGALGSSTGSSSSSTGSSGSSTGSTTPSPTGSTGASTSSKSVQRYSQCIINAHNDVSKMQQCASLINGQ